MKHSLKTIFALICFAMFCNKEQKMDDSTSIIPKPIVYSFYKGDISHLFSVVQNKSIGIAFDAESVAVAKLHRDELEVDVFPDVDSFTAYGADGFYQKNTEILYVKDKRFIQKLDWKNKRVISMFAYMDNPYDIYLEKSKVIDYQNGLAMSLTNYFVFNEPNSEGQYSFVIDDILNKKRLKEVSLPDFISMPVFFTPSYVFYQYTTMKDTDQYYNSPWMVLDNNLTQTNHPLADLLNKNAKDTVFSVGEKMMQVSEELKHALIETYNHITKKDMLYLATWYNKPSIQPIVIDYSKIFGDRRLVTSTDNNTMSPSGHWVYFCAESQNNIDKDLHFLIYLDPKLPNGYLPPLKLNIEGNIGCVGWVTKPEGFMLYKNNQLFYYDLSEVKIP